MFCPFCGIEIFDHASICNQCGSIINLPPEMTEAEIRRFRNDYREHFVKVKSSELLKSIEERGDYMPALYSARAFAFILDSALIIGLAILIGNQTPQSREITPLIVPVIAFFYLSFFTALSGRTIGKFIVGIKTIDSSSGDNPGILVSFGRTVAMLISFLFLMAGFLSPFFDAKSRCWHDIMSGTRVIYRR